MDSHDTLEQIRMLNKESQAGLLFCYKALKIYDNSLLSYTSLSLSVITCLVFIIYILV